MAAFEAIALAKTLGTKTGTVQRQLEIPPADVVDARHRHGEDRARRETDDGFGECRSVVARRAEKNIASRVLAVRRLTAGHGCQPALTRVRVP